MTSGARLERPAMSDRATRLSQFDAGAAELEAILDQIEGPDRPTRGNGLLPVDPAPSDPPAAPRADEGNRYRARRPCLPGVYIAAPWPLKAMAAALAAELRNSAIPVTARWIDQPNTPQDTDAMARMDLADVEAADAVVLLNPRGWEDRGTGGRHVEFGYALCLARSRRSRLFVLGVRSNVFHELTDVVVVSNVGELVALLIGGGIHG